MRTLVASLAAAAALAAVGSAQAAAAPSYTLSAHCAGLTVSATDYPAGSKLLVYTGRYRSGSTLRVNRVFAGATTARVEFAAGEASNTYSVQLTGPGVPSVVRSGTQVSCTPRYPNQIPVLPPLGW